MKVEKALTRIFLDCAGLFCPVDPVPTNLVQKREGRIIGIKRYYMKSAGGKSYALEFPYHRKIERRRIFRQLLFRTSCSSIGFGFSIHKNSTLVSVTLTQRIITMSRLNYLSTAESANIWYPAMNRSSISEIWTMSGKFSALTTKLSGHKYIQKIV